MHNEYAQRIVNNKCSESAKRDTQHATKKKHHRHSLEKNPGNPEGKETSEKSKLSCPSVVQRKSRPRTPDTQETANMKPTIANGMPLKKWTPQPLTT